MKPLKSIKGPEYSEFFINMVFMFLGTSDFCEKRHGIQK